MIPLASYNRDTATALPNTLFSLPAIALLLIFSLLVPLPALSAQNDPDLKAALGREIEAVLEDSALRNAHVGIIVESLEGNKRIFEHNGSKRFVPASNMKLFATAAALLSLSPDFRYETRLLTDGAVLSGVLHGNLIIKGSCDPTISGYFNENNPSYVFERWASKLKEMGIREVRGGIMIDNSAFTGRPYGAGWVIDDATHCYSARKDAFTFNNNCVQLDIIPAEETGERARIVMEPATGYIKIDNRVATGNTDSKDAVDVEYTTPEMLRVSGSVTPGGKTITRYIAVHYPAHFGGSVLKEVLSSGGIKVKGGITCTRNCPGKKAVIAEKRKDPLKTIALYRSPKLAEIVKVVNKISNNLYAEMLLLAVGKTAGKTTTTEEAIAAACRTMRAAGIDTEGLTMADASGLSRYNLVTPVSIVSLLKVMAKGPYAAQFLESLPVMSVEGTLKNRLKDSPAVGRVLAKTGTMTHVRSLSGYITTMNNETFVFSILSNNHDVPPSVIDDAVNRIILKILEYPTSDQ